MATQIKRLLQNGTEFVPITLAEAVVVNVKNFNGINLGYQITTLDDVLRHVLSELVENNTDITDINSAINAINLSLAAVNKKVDDNKLEAGVGITIENGKINCTLNAQLYQIVASVQELDALLSRNEAQFNKIYLVPFGNVNRNSYGEFILVEKNGIKSWEQIGTVLTTTDLSGYVTKSEYDSKIQEIEAKLTSTDISKVVTAVNLTLSTNNNTNIVANYNIPNNLYDSMVTSNNDNIQGQ